mgnify:CR=1 FL=1
MSTTFYQNLPASKSLYKLLQTDSFIEIPEDWYIIITDITNSTEAIEKGKYKEVNSISVSAIIALSNINKSIEIPYTFGGDGVYFAIPKTLFESVHQALAGVQSMAHELYKLSLRVGIFKHSDIIKLGFHCLTGKFKSSGHTFQASFAGKGWSHAEHLLKNQDPHNLFAPELHPKKLLSSEADLIPIE